MMKDLRMLVVPLLLAACAPSSNPPAVSSVEPDAAAKQYAALLVKEPNSASLRYNVGTALLQARDYSGAKPHLEIAVRAVDVSLREKAFYNLGNVGLEPAFADSTLQGRREVLLHAIEAYKEALLVGPDDHDAKWNLELARRLLEAENPPPATEGSGGGGAGGGEGGGAGDDARPGELNPQPESPGLTREAADQILSGARDSELEVQREKLSKPQPPNSAAY